MIQFAVAAVGVALMATGVSQQLGAARKTKHALERQAQAFLDLSEAQKEEAELEQRRADIENARTTRTAIRQARIARAAVLNTAANSGTTGSSGALGGTGSIQSQLASNLGYFEGLLDLNQEVLETKKLQADARARIGIEEGNVRKAQGKSSIGGAIGSLGSSILGAGGGFGGLMGGK